MNCGNAYLLSKNLSEEDFDYDDSGVNGEKSKGVRYQSLRSKIMKKLNISLELETVKHLEDKSCYNCNYYELEPYGDWCIFFNGNNIIEEICHEDDDFYTYSLGHFDGEEFVGVVQWDGEYGEKLF